MSVTKCDCRCDVYGVHLECGNCGNKFDYLVPKSQVVPEKAKCPECECEAAVQRVAKPAVLDHFQPQQAMQRQVQAMPGDPYTRWKDKARGIVEDGSK